MGSVVTIVYMSVDEINFHHYHSFFIKIMVKYDMLYYNVFQESVT